MNVCMVSTAHDARDDRLYFKVAKTLAKEHTVTLIAPSTRNVNLQEDANLTFIRLACDKSKFSRVLMVLRLLFTLPRGLYDVIHISDCEMMAISLFLKWRCKSKIVYDIWEANYELILGSSTNPGIIRRILASIFRFLEKNISRHCDLVLTADNDIAEALGPKIHPIVIFNYPLLNVLFPERDEVSKLREKYKQARCIIYQGSMAEERGVLEAVAAMQYVCARHPNAKLLLVGKFPRKLEIQFNALILNMGLGNAVDLIGWVDHTEVGAYLKVSEIGLVPFARTRKFEKNIPQKIFEYWAAGIPIIGTNLAPIQYFVSRCGGGLLTESNDPEILANAVCALLSQPETAKRMGLQGKTMVENAWRWEYMEQKLLSAYRVLAGGLQNRSGETVM